MTDNIIPFPGSKRSVEEPPKPEPAVEKTDEEIRSEIEVISAIISAQLINLIIQGGFEYKEEHVKDLALITTTLKSYISKYYDKHHPFQDLAEQAIGIADDGSIFLRTFQIKEKKKKGKSNNDDSGPQ